MNTKFYPQWLRLTAVLILFLAALAPVSPAYADSCHVTSNADSGAGSLREKIADPVCDTITFDGHAVIVLASQLTIDRNLMVNGAGYDITISGNHAVRVFEIRPGVTFNLSNMTVTNGNKVAVGGGGIYNRGTLNVRNVVFSANSTTFGGGGIYNQGTLTVTESAFLGNSAAEHGGGIYSDGDALTVTHTIFSGNSAGFGGGGIASWRMLIVTDSTFLENSAEYGGGIYDVEGGMVTNSTFSANTAVEIGGGIMTGGLSDTKLLTVTDSTFSGNSADYGAGIRNHGGTTNVTNSTFTNNTATSDGGGIDNVPSGTGTVTGTSFNGNLAKRGAGIHSAGTLSVADSTFSGNSAIEGGGIRSQFGTADVTNSVFTDNSATWSGGGMNVSYGSVTVAGSSFKGNHSDIGAGIYSSGTLSVTDSTVTGNNAQSGGGGIYNSSVLNVSDSTLSWNSVGFGNGGGIFNNAGTAALTNTTYYKNTAMNGGGIFNNVGIMTLTNSTLSGNSGVEGGAILNSEGTATFKNTIVAKNTSGHSCLNQGTFTGSYNLTDDATCYPFFDFSSSILLGPLAENGGPTRTLALLPGSAAIDVGDDAFCPDTDQRGVSRPQGARCDIGAYEAEITTDSTPPTITLTTPDEDAVYLLGQSVNADYACQDEAGGSGLASCVGNVPNGSPIDTGSVGVKIFSVNAADNAGNVASVTHTYRVIYNFIGFTSPVDNPSVMNSAKAGQTIPLKWRITDADGNPVTNLAGMSVTAVSLSCPSAPTTDAIEEYATSNSGLQNLGDGYYQWNWRSPTSYANTCKTLELDLGEGAGFEHLALFQFRK